MLALPHLDAEPGDRSKLEPTMLDQELTFLGADAKECTTFIREVYKRALQAGRARDNHWMADLAMTAFDEDALLWFAQQPEETCGDWRLLRRALTERFCQNRLSTAVPAAVPTLAAIPRPTLSPSGRLNFITDADKPRFHIRVTAPTYSGYISKTLVSTPIGNACSLTESPNEAQEWVEIFQRMTQFEGQGGYVFTVNTMKDFDHEWLCAVQSRSDGICYRLTFGHHHIPTDRWSLVGEPATRKASELEGRWNIANNGRITLRNRGGHTFMIAKSQDGAPTVILWSRRFWEEDDDAYVSELHLVRAV